MFGFEVVIQQGSPDIQPSNLVLPATSLDTGESIQR